MIYANMIPTGSFPALAVPARAIDARCPSGPSPSAATLAPARTHSGDTARGRPPSPYIGAGTIVAMQWVVFGACILQWALG